MSDDVPEVNLAKLAYDNPTEFYDALRPYGDLVVDDWGKLYKIAMITSRLNADTVVVTTPNLGAKEDVEVHCIDALLAHESFPVS
jgi:hypothetical protein